MNLFDIQFKRGYLRFWEGIISDYEAKLLVERFHLPKSAISILTARKFFKPKELEDVLNSFEIGRFIVEHKHFSSMSGMRDYDIFLLGTLE